MAGTIWSVDFFTGYEGMAPVPDDLGCRAFVENSDGWFGLAAPRVTQTDNPTGDGTFDGKSTQPGKTVTLSGTVRAPDQITLLTWCDRFRSLLTDGDRNGTLTVTEPHVTRTMTVRRGAEAFATPYKTTEAKFSAILYGPKGIAFGDPVTGSTFLPSSAGGGLRFPLHFPIHFAAAVNPGTILLNNAGTAASNMILRVWGPTTGPIITDNVSGNEFVFASSYAIGSGAYVDIDMDNRRVLENGQASRIETVTQRGWFRFAKGSNVIGFNAAVYDPASKLDATGQPAWY